MKPTAEPKAERREDADDDRQVVVARDDGDGHRAGRDHRADREIEMPGDHQQPDRERDDAELGGDVEPARGAAGRQEIGAAEDREEDQDGDQADQRADLGPAHEAADRRPRIGQGKRSVAALDGWTRRRISWKNPRRCEHGTVGADLAVGSATGMSGPRMILGPDIQRWALAGARRRAGQRRVDVGGVDDPRSGQHRLGRQVEPVVDEAVQQRHGKIALQVGLLVDREQLRAVLDALAGRSRPCRTKRA